jgi:hypothetical protein
MPALWLALLAAVARAQVSGGASGKASVTADLDVTFRLQDGKVNDNCTDLCIFSRDGQCDEPSLCAAGTDCDCDPTMSVVDGLTGKVLYNYSNVATGAPKSLIQKFHLTQSDRDGLYIGVIVVSSFMLLLLVLRCSKPLFEDCCCGEWEIMDLLRQMLLWILPPLIVVGSIVFTAFFSGSEKPFSGFGPMRKDREDLLFKPTLPLAGYCGLNFSSGYNATTQEQVAHTVDYLAFHEGITLITVVLFTSLILPEVGFAKFKDPNEEKERVKRHGTELKAFCGALNPCATTSKNSIAGKVGNKAQARLSAAVAAKKDEMMGEIEGMDLQGKALEAAGDEESELPGFYSSGVLGNMKKIKETLELVIASIDQALAKMEELHTQAATAGDGTLDKVSGVTNQADERLTQVETTAEKASDTHIEAAKDAGKNALKGTKSFRTVTASMRSGVNVAKAKRDNLVKVCDPCYNLTLRCGRLLLQGLQLFMDFCTNFLPVLTSAGQIVAFCFGVYAYYSLSIGGSDNCNYLYLVSMVYFKPILLPWTKLVIASVRGGFKTDEPIPKTALWDATQKKAQDYYVGTKFGGFHYAVAAKGEVPGQELVWGTDCLSKCHTYKLNGVIILTYNFFVTVFNFYNEWSQRVLGAISYGGHYMLSIAIVMLMTMVPLLLVPIALYTSGLYEGEDYFVVTQWILWFLQDMWNLDEMNFSMNLTVRTTTFCCQDSS